MKAPFGVSQYTTWTQTFAEDLALYTELGIQHIEVCEAKLDAKRPDAQLRALQDTGMNVSSVQARFHSPFPNSLRAVPAEPAARMKLLGQSVRLFGKHFPGTTLVVNTGLAPQGDWVTAYRVAGREFKKLSKLAADCGVTIALEPLHPFYMNTDTFIASLTHAERMIDDVDHPAFGLFLDLWHVWDDPQAPARIRRFRGKLFGVHLSDWGTPRAFADRLLPGTGAIPTVPLLRAARAAGYRGAYTLEIFSDSKLKDSLWAHPRRTVVQGMKAFDKIWKKTCA